MTVQLKYICTCFSFLVLIPRTGLCLLTMNGTGSNDEFLERSCYGRLNYINCCVTLNDRFDQLITEVSS